MKEIDKLRADIRGLEERRASFVEREEAARRALEEAHEAAIAGAAGAAERTITLESEIRAHSGTTGAIDRRLETLRIMLAEAEEKDRVEQTRALMEAEREAIQAADREYVAALTELSLAFEAAISTIERSSSLSDSHRRGYRRHAQSIGEDGDLDPVLRPNLGRYGQAIGMAVNAALKEGHRESMRQKIASA